jgi:ribonuclease J
MTRQSSPESIIELAALGGFGEVGKNSLVLEHGRDLVLVDAGVMFPPEELHGVDLVIPDFGYVRKHVERLKGILITHGHEDHVGALPYLLKQLGRPVPIYSLPLSIGLVEPKLREHGVTPLANLIPVVPGDRYALGSFSAEFVPISHSVPDSASIVLRTANGTIFVSGDFKFDQTPVDGKAPNLSHLRAIGDEGVLLLLSDCVRVDRPGITPSERIVGEALDRIVGEAPGRVILTTFASNITRLEQAIAIAHRHGRKVAVVGRSMEENLDVAAELGYLTVPVGAVVPIDQLRSLPAREAMILTTGSQGEPTSVLSRIAMGEHAVVRINPGDTVVISATPIPGNEETVSRTIDNLMRHGARVLYPPVEPNIHVSGHASRDELRALLDLARPRFVVPVHGEYRQMVHYRDLALEAGLPDERILFVEVGDRVVFSADSYRIVRDVPAGSVLVDGLTVGGVNQVVLRDRRHLASDGIVIAAVALDRENGRLLSGPDVTARGFIAPAASSVLQRSAERLRRALSRRESGEVEHAFVAAKIKDVLGQVIFQQTHLRPMILPVITEI